MFTPRRFSAGRVLSAASIQVLSCPATAVWSSGEIESVQSTSRTTYAMSPPAVIHPPMALQPAGVSARTYRPTPPSRNADCWQAISWKRRGSRGQRRRLLHDDAGALAANGPGSRDLFPHLLGDSREGTAGL